MSMQDRDHKGDPIPSAYDYQAKGRSDLETWLNKVATESESRGPELQSNEDTSTVGTNQLYEDPEGRESENTEASWGEKGPKDPFHNSDGAWDESKKVRREVLDNAMSGLGNASEVDQKLMAENFQAVAQGNFESHSVLLQPKTKTGSQTLTDKVNELLGSK